MKMGKVVSLLLVLAAAGIVSCNLQEGLDYDPDADLFRDKAPPQSMENEEWEEAMKKSRLWRFDVNASEWEESELGAAPSVRMIRIDPQHVVLDNGLVMVTLSEPAGMVTAISYRGIRNLLDITNRESGRGYWDIVWNSPTSRLRGMYNVYEGRSFRVVVENENQIELSFSRVWNPIMPDDLPLNIDKRFVMLRGSSGFYSYAIYDHPKNFPDLAVGQTRIAFKLNPSLFHYMAVSDTRQRMMPTAGERARGKMIEYPEAVKLPNDLPNPSLRGEVDDKYQYSGTIKDTFVHGWISPNPRVGFWLITPSEEYRAGGPLKQELSSHVGPTTLCPFFSAHYSGEDLTMYIKGGEAWKKVYGPVFIYLNGGWPKDDFHVLWNNAKSRMIAERRSWPYNFPASVDYPHAEKRGSVTGKFLVHDWYKHTTGPVAAGGAYVGLAPIGEPGSWQRDTKGYQFWTQADANGNFVINNVREGSYNLYAWVTGFIGDFKHRDMINISPGSRIWMGHIVYETPRIGPTIWEIGIPDRTAAEFFVPDPYPDVVNHLYVKIERFRQYGLWNRYTDYYPNGDLVYTVGVSDWRRDWFFAHKSRTKLYVPTTWRIIFNLPSVHSGGTYTLWIAIATGNAARIKVGINNDPNKAPPIFVTPLLGRDNAIARHGVHGLYWLLKVDVPSHSLYQGSNTIFLQQVDAVSRFCGLMYDYLRLEGPPLSSH